MHVHFFMKAHKPISPKLHAVKSTVRRCHLKVLLSLDLTHNFFFLGINECRYLGLDLVISDNISALSVIKAVKLDVYHFCLHYHKRRYSVLNYRHGAAISRDSC